MKFRISNSVGNFKEKIEKSWGIKEWEGWSDPDRDLLYFGMYHEFDYTAFRNFDGKKTIFWCGSDILRLIQSPESQRIVKLDPAVEHYCETEIEAFNLRKVGIEPIIIPSFLEPTEDFPISYKPTDKPHVFLSAHPNREEEYGVTLIEETAPELPKHTFHIYGLEGKSHNNIKYHGQVSNEQFNKEIRNYHCGFRGNLHDGFSEIPIKAILQGKYAITRMKFEHMWNYETKEQLVEQLKKLAQIKDPNLEAREYWISKINSYPWISPNPMKK